MDSFIQVAAFSDRLRTAMEVRGKKQIDLVRETGINRSAISRYLSGEYEPKTKPIYELAKALDVSEQWLMGYDAPMDRPQKQKNNDAITDIIVELKNDNDFFALVKTIYGFDKEKRKSLAKLLQD